MKKRMGDMSGARTYQISGKSIIMISLLSALFASGIVACFSSLKNSNGQSKNQIIPVGDFHLKDIEAEEANNEAVYLTASPGVVNITNTTYVQGFFEVYPTQGTGSGSIIDDQGHILTNFHVIQNAQQLDVALADKSHYKGKVIGADPSNDLAIIQINAPREKLHLVTLGSSTDLKIGQKVLAIGNPFGLERTLTTGIISGLGRPLRAPDGRLIDSVIQTDAAINPGNSGGPLLNARGEMVGINSAIYSPNGGGNIGIGFAVPVDKAKELIPDLIALGRVRKPWLGIQTLPLNERIAEDLNLTVGKGLMVIGMSPDGPAQRSGLKLGETPVTDGRNRFYVGGDVITKIDGEEVQDNDQLSTALGHHKIGDTIKLEIIRNGHSQTLIVKLGEQATSAHL